MSIVETYYLIDFENVHEDGLSGSEKLGKHDHVHLFSTKNAPIRSSTINTDFSKKKTQLNSNIQRAVSSAGYSAPTSNKVASIVVKHYGEDKVLSNVHNELRNKYSDYLNLYNIIKPLMFTLQTLFPNIVMTRIIKI